MVLCRDRQTERSVFCVRKQLQDKEQVKCANDDCNNGSMFHLSHVNLKQQPARLSYYITTTFLGPEVILFEVKYVKNGKLQHWTQRRLCRLPIGFTLDDLQR